MASFLVKPSQRQYGILAFPASFLLPLLLWLTFLFSFFQLNVQAVKHRNPVSDDTRLLRIIVDTAINHIVILLCAGFFGTFGSAILQKLLVMQQFRLLFSQKSLYSSEVFSTMKL